MVTVTANKSFENVTEFKCLRTITIKCKL